MAESMGMSIRDVYQGVEKISMGYKLLASMGWQEGEGLGSNKQGIKTHIKATKKFDNSGVGAKESAARAQDWTLSMHTYTQVLSGLKEVTSAHAHGSADSEAEDNAAGNQCLGSPKKAAKRKRSEGGPTKRKAAKVALAPAEEEARVLPAKKALATHSGRYSKREKNKAVKGYSAVDLAAILGQADPAPLIAEVSMRREEPSSDDETEGAGPSLAATGLRRKQADSHTTKTAEPLGRASDKRPAAPAANSLVAKETAIVRVDDSPEDACAWWRGMFRRAGIVGSHKVKSKMAEDATKQALITIHGFSEQDQTDLFTRAQSSKNSGRLGLGQATAPKKVAGARWAGTKTVLNSDSDGEDDEAPNEESGQQEAADDGAAGGNDDFVDVLPGGVTIAWHNGVRPQWFLASRAARAAGTREQDSTADEAVGKRKDAAAGKLAKAGKKGKKRVRPQLSCEAKLLCVKAAKRALKKSASGSLKLAKLHARVAKAVTLAECDSEGWAEMLTDLFQSESSLSVQGDRVSLTLSA